jgi:hypothetical protein
MLRDHLSSLRDDQGRALYDVTSRDREANKDENDNLLSSLDTTDFDEVWLFAVDQGDGLSVADCEGITRFRQRGGGMLTTRDHQDLGSSLCTLGGVGRAHFFHTRQPEPDGYFPGLSQFLGRATRQPNRTRLGETQRHQVLFANVANWLATPGSTSLR